MDWDEKDETSVFQVPPGASDTDKIAALRRPGEAEPAAAVEVSPEDQFPALKKLSARRGGRIPYVQQLHATDCGAACLAMVLAFHKRSVALDDLRQEMGVGGAGIDALSIARCAERHNMHARGISLDVDSLKYLPPATILHWEFRHFVVFDRLSKKGVHIVDPAMGRRLIPMTQFRKSFTGVALVCEPTDAFQTIDPDKSRIWAYLKQLLNQRSVLARVIVVSILLRLFALALPILTAMIVDRVVPRGDTRLLLVVGAGLLGMVLFQFFSEFIRAHLMLQLRTNLDIKMTLGFIDHLIGLSYEFFQRRSAGDLMMRVNSNTTVRELITASTLTALLDGVLVFAYLAMIVSFSGKMALLVLGLGMANVMLLLASARTIRDLMAEHLEAQSRSQSYLVQMMSGIETLKVSGSELRSIEHWSNLFVDELNVSLKRGRLSAVLDSLKGALGMIGPLLILGFGALEVINGNMTLGTMLALNALAAGFLSPLGSLVSSAMQLQVLGSYIERINDVLAAEPEQAPGSAVVAPRLKGSISLDRVSFRYSPTLPLVVKEISLEIPTGKSVALVGSSGSGKSTLASLIMGLYKPTQGRILYDSRDLWELQLRSVRSQLGIVPQHPYIFGGSIRENIALPKPTATLDEIVDAARLACLHEDIMQMPMGYETLVTDGGGSLSGGQRQRLSLARALLRRPAIVLLDEATSALDARTELRVMESLSRLKCTRVIIAHRLSTIANADEIIVLDQGSIVERGTHDQLVRMAGGAYQGLVAAQSSMSREAAG